MDTTFSQLQENHKARLLQENGEIPIQVLRNHLSALNSYLAYCGKSVENRIGREFTDKFIEQSKAFVDMVCKNKKSAADKLSILRSWKKSVDLLIKAIRREPVSGQSKFHTELRAAVARCGESVNEICRNARATPYSVGKWIHGAYPGKKGMPTLRRLEIYLGLVRGHLENLLPRPMAGKQVITAAHDDKYIARHVENGKHHYYLPWTALTPIFIEEWFAFLRYKTAEFSVDLKRNPKGRWRVLPIEKVWKKSRNKPLTQLSPMYVVPSAERVLEIIRAYMGFLQLPKGPDPTRSGVGLDCTMTQSLAIFLVPEFLNAYLEFMKARAGNNLHTGHVVVTAFIASLVRPGEGYLWQQPSFFESIRQYAKGRTFEQLCAKTMELCEAWQISAKGSKSRDPALPLRNLFKLENPLEPFKRAIQKLDEAAAGAAPGGCYQAVYKRNALLLAIEISNPLRLRTFSLAKYVPPDASSGYETNLYQTDDGNWRLRFSKEDFKNGESKKEEYDAPLPSGLNARIVEYLSEYRPVLLRDNPSAPWLFPSMKGCEHVDLGTEIAGIARSYIPEVTRLRPHGLRHIVASDFLRRNPGQYTVVAELLHDRLETVLKNYAHQQRESAFKAHERHLGAFLSGL